MRRRALLAAVPASLTLPGCIDALDSSGDLPTEQGPSDATASTSGGTEVQTTDVPPTEPTPDVTVHDVTLQYGLVWLDDDAIYVSESSTAFVLADVSVADEFSRGGFELRVGEASVAPRSPDVHHLYRGDEDDWYDGSGRGLLLFEPSRAGLEGEPPEMRLTWPGGEHALDDGLAERLARGPPSFDATIEAPAEVPADDAEGEHEVTVTATNRGDGPARFLGAINRTGPRIAYTVVQRVSAVVAPGDTVRLDVTDQWSDRPSEEAVGDCEPDVTYRLDWGGGYERSDIRAV